MLLFTSGFLSPWNDLPTKNAVWLVDRVLRSRIEYTLPERNVDTSAKPVVVPINASQRNEQFYLVRPNGKEQLLEVERIGRDEFGVTVSDFAQRGLYRVATRKLRQRRRCTGRQAGRPRRARNAAVKPAAEKDLDELIAANGPADESKLASIDEAAAAAKLKPEGRGPTGTFPLGRPRRADQPLRRGGLGARHLVVADLDRVCVACLSS